MPELPEIETIKNDVLPLICGKVIDRIVIRNADLRWPVTAGFSKEALLQKVKMVMRRGKYLIIQCSEGNILIHLGMSGSLTVVPENKAATKHDHIDICFTNDFCLRFNDPRKFGCVLWSKENFLKHKLLENLGIEPLTKEFNQDYLFAKTCRSKRMIKSLLMDSKIIAGVGNIYANESLFEAKTNPTTVSNKLSKTQCEKIVLGVKKILLAAIKAGGTSFKDYRKVDGTHGMFQKKLLVYGRQGMPCKNCKTILKQINAINGRLTVYCPVCQK